MEDLLKFIPIALFLAYKLFGSSKKKEQKPNSRPKPTKRNTPSQSTPSLEDILRELSGEKSPVKKEIPVPEPVRETLAQERKREQIEIGDHQYDVRPEYEHHADVGSDMSKVRSKIRKSQGMIEEEQNVSSADFNLKQAIIAQVILTRPEY